MKNDRPHRGVTVKRRRVPLGDPVGQVEYRLICHAPRRYTLVLRAGRERDRLRNFTEDDAVAERTFSAFARGKVTPFSLRETYEEYHEIEK